MLKFSLLGYGHIGKVHKAAIEATPNAEFISIIDKELDEEVSGCIVYQSLDEFLNEDKQTDVVVIATPNGLHAKHAIKCLNAGKHVLIEKPITLNIKDAKSILETAKKNGKRVFSSMQLRFSPPVSFVKELLSNNKLGKIYMVNIHCYWNRNKEYYKVRDWSGSEEMDGGVLFTQFSHFIDIMNFWFDETKVTHSSFFNFNHGEITEFPDSGRLEFDADETKGNMVFTISTYQKNYRSSITLIAENGTVEIGDQYLNKLIYCNVEGVNPPESASTEIKNFHPLAIAEVIRAIENDDESVLDGNHAIRLVEFIETAHNGASK